MAGSFTVTIATDRASILRCHDVLRELRPHLDRPEPFAEQVLRQRTQGYRLAYLEAEHEVRAAAGYRVLEKLSAGRFLYVDDLVTREVDRGKGFGSRLFDWLWQQALDEGCTMLQLDSGVQRFGAHRFYLRKGMNITCHHFDLAVMLPGA